MDRSQRNRHNHKRVLLNTVKCVLNNISKVQSLYEPNADATSYFSRLCEIHGKPISLEFDYLRTILISSYHIVQTLDDTYSNSNLLGEDQQETLQELKGNILALGSQPLVLHRQIPKRQKGQTESSKENRKHHQVADTAAVKELFNICMLLRGYYENFLLQLKEVQVMLVTVKELFIDFYRLLIEHLDLHPNVYSEIKRSPNIRHLAEFHASLPNPQTTEGTVVPQLVPLVKLTVWDVEAVLGPCKSCEGKDNESCLLTALQNSLLCDVQI